MAQVKLNLQPPPNIDFVIGYPGIPPGPDRPQASVKGAIELRTPPQGVKAKWVRIELRKVETLPGGGPTNTFYDFVGPSPVNLWNTDEYNQLRSQDFPFSIRIPESIPPTISLDNRAGIGYELVASVCTKGKRGFLRKAKSVVTSTVSPIIIDKHELHSTWPIYCQPETRHLAQEGVNLIVERTNNCYGPGDRVAVIATVKSDSLHTVILRGFEFSLKEATVFRAGVHAPGGRRSAPQTRQFNIAENKVAVNATLYGGTSHTSELSCMISNTHTTTTLNAARHIDVTYTLVIKALMGTGTHLVMELPVIVSNWERHVSLQAISQIGSTPGLSIVNPAPGAAGITSRVDRVDPSRVRPADVVANTLPTQRGNIDSTYDNSPASVFNTAPAKTPDVLGYGTGFIAGRSGNGLVDEFGSTKPTLSTTPSVTASTSAAATAQTVASSTTPTATGRRPGSAGGGTRFTVKNAMPQEIPQENVTRQRSAQATGSGSGSGSGSGDTSQKHWPSAEEEKKLYEQARIKVAKTQGVAASPPPADLRDMSPPQAVNSSPPRGSAAAGGSAAGPAANAWLSAHEEKRLFQQAQAAVEKAANPPASAQDEKRLFQQAQAAVDRVANPQMSAQDEKRLFQQAQAAVERAANPPTAAQSHTRNNSDPKSSGSGSKPSTGAELYAQAINARAAAAASAQASAGGSSAAPAKSVPQYLTAEQEKAALRRYEEAKRAVDRTQNSDGSSSSPGNSEPIAYESLFPASRGTPGASSSHPPPAANPPPAEAPPPPFDSVMSNIPEKERLRRAYEAQDAAALAHQRNPSPPPPAAYPAPAPTPAPAPAPTGPSLPGQYANALEEKEALRRKFAARDNAQAARANSTTNPPQRANSALTSGGSSAGNEGSSSPGRSPSSNTSGFRPTPVPPAGSRVLTAVEEKALLRAKYEARDSGNNRKPSPALVTTTNGLSSVNGSSGAMPPTPPPLMPRPPVEYIKETQEEDARLSRINGEVPLLDGATRRLNGAASSSSINASAPPSGANSLDMKPFTPFRAGFDTPLASPGPPPPLPPKPAGE